MRKFKGIAVSRLMLMALSILFALPASAMTLPVAIQNALQTNPDVRYYGAQRRASNNRMDIARAGYFPSLELTAGYGREKSLSPAGLAIGGSRKRTLWRRELGATLTQNVFAGFETISEVRRNKAAICADAYKVEGTANDTALAVTKAYLDVLRYSRLVSLARQNLAVHQRIMDFIQKRSTAGVAREAEVEQTKGRLALANSNLVSELTNLRDAKTEFVRVANVMPNSLTLPSSPSNRLIPRNMDSALDMALAQHPMLKSALADVTEAREQHNTSKATNWPRIDLILNARRDKDLDGIPGRNEETMAIVRGSYFLFRGGADFARQRETADQIQEATEVKNRALLDVEQSMRLSLVALRQEQRRQGYLLRHKNSADATRLAYREQFKIGQRTLLDVLDSENEYFQSSIDYVNSRFNELYDRYRVLNAKGEILAYAGVKLPLEASIATYCAPKKREYKEGPVKYNGIFKKGKQDQAQANTSQQNSKAVAISAQKSPVKADNKLAKQAADADNKLAKKAVDVSNKLAKQQPQAKLAGTQLAKQTSAKAVNNPAAKMVKPSAKLASNAVPAKPAPQSFFGRIKHFFGVSDKATPKAQAAKTTAKREV